MSKKGGGAANKKEEVSSLYKDLAALRPTEDFDPSTEDYEKAIIHFQKAIDLNLEYGRKAYGGPCGRHCGRTVRPQSFNNDSQLRCFHERLLFH